MLRELTVENLLLIEQANLDLAEGLNVLTGETGAGKTLLATALGLLIGDRSKTGLVRAGAKEAWVEGVFAWDDSLPPEILENLPDDSEEIVLARRIWPDGRSRAQINGRTATVGDLRELAGHLISFHGQHEHRKLALASFQRESLDSSCAPGHQELLNKARVAHEQVTACETHLANLTGSGDGAERESDLLEFELNEIIELDPKEGEVEALAEEIGRLESATALIQASTAAAEALSPADENPGASGMIASCERPLESLEGVDPELDAISTRLVGLRIELEELAREFRTHANSVQASPERLAEARERHQALLALSRKHGGSIASVLAHAKHCQDRLAELSDLDGAVSRAKEELEGSRKERGKIHEQLHNSRVAAAQSLAADVQSALAHLALDGSSFSIEVSQTPEATVHGSDRIEFLFSANPGLQPGPLGDVASGGEMSRVLLALLTAQRNGNSSAKGDFIVFDEIDAGIGGRTARAVGERLKNLSEQSQVLCITHLPQVAVLGERHFVIDKSTGSDESLTRVKRVEGAELVDEMVRMLGGKADDHAARAHAVELLEAA